MKLKSGQPYRLVGYKLGEFYIPKRMMGGISRYINQGVLPGEFLQAVICNDLREACGKADDENIANLPAYVAYFYNEVPANCWGSRKTMQEWVQRQSRQKEEGGS